MTEALLHHIWKFKLFNTSQFQGTQHEQIEIVDPGFHNSDSGPDFFSARIRIDGLLMIGNVEIHLKTSDWLKHHHQNDPAYDNLLVHAVFEHDVELQQNKANRVAVLELRPYISSSTLHRYSLIATNPNPICCGTGITSVPSITWNSWLNRMAVSRIEEKVDYIEHLYRFTAHDFEETLYILLARNFGFKTNAAPFELLAKQLPLKTIRKHLDHPLVVEALLFGTAGFLEEPYEEEYPRLLQNEFEFLKHKYQILPMKKELWKFMRLRPANFPPLRLAQLAAVFVKNESFFHLLETKPDIQTIRRFFNAQLHPYWHTHFKPGNLSVEKPKSIGNSSVSSIIINTIVPYLFFLSRHHQQESYIEYGLDLLSDLEPEKNMKTAGYEALGARINNALESQAVIHLHDNFCTAKRCLECSVAGFLLKNSAG
ncbi:MAG: DUF2851 family protein [Bacteroidetes bacterium]|nr:DUF2851 family protein [Bacteroidota bacterium]